MSCIDVTKPLYKPQKTVLVVAALIIDADNRILLAQRPPQKEMAGLWEFPGGKVESGELPEAALVRELAEELGIKTSPSCLQPLTFASHSYPTFHLLMPIYACRVWTGEPQPRDGQTLAWTTKHEWKKYKMPPADDVVLPILFEMI